MSNSSFSNPITIFNTVQPGPGIATSNGTVSIATNGISNSLFRQSVANSLVGNPLGSTANVQDITMGTGLLFSGTNLILGTSGVTAGTYGSLFTSPQLTVDALGRITLAGTNAIVFPDTHMKNYIINGGMVIAQRAIASTSNGAYVYGGCDMFAHYVNFTTSSGTIQQTAGTYPTTKFWNRIGPITTTGTGDVYFRTRIESSFVTVLNNKTITISGKLSQDTGATIGASLFLFKPTVADDYTGQTQIGTTASLGNFTSGVDGTFSTSFTLGASDASLGLEIYVGFPTISAGTNKNFYLGDLQLEVGTASTSFEVRPITAELLMCQRYLPGFTNGNSSPNFARGLCYSSTTGRILFPFPTTTRKPPTGIAINYAANNWAIVQNNGNPQPGSAVTFINASTTAGQIDIATGGGFVAGNATMAQHNGGTLFLVFTGAEL